VGISFGCLLGSLTIAALVAAARLIWGPTRVIFPECEAMHAAVQSATATLPYLPTGVTHDSARHSIIHLKALTQASCVIFADEHEILTPAGEGCDALRIGTPPPRSLVPGRKDRLLVEPRLPEPIQGLPFGSAVAVPLVARAPRVGSLIAPYHGDQRLRSDGTRVVSETGALIAAQLDLAEMEAQNQRLALAELRALRAQISPHFIFNAVVAVAAAMRTSTDEARDLLAEFAHFIRYAFRGQRPCVTLAAELHYIEKYLRLEHARFGDRIKAPSQRSAGDARYSSVGSVGPAVGGERGQTCCRKDAANVSGEVLGAHLNSDVEMCVRDDGPGMSEEAARRALEGRSGG
jgi:two-component system, LytTR family, sensor kinase